MRQGRFASASVAVLRAAPARAGPPAWEASLASQLVCSAAAEAAVGPATPLQVRAWRGVHCGSQGFNAPRRAGPQTRAQAFAALLLLQPRTATVASLVDAYCCHVAR